MASKSLLVGGEDDGDVDFEPSSSSANSRSKRTRKTLKRDVNDEYSDEDVDTPQKKRAKSTAKKSSSPPQITASNPRSTSVSAKKGNESNRSTSKHALSSEKVSEERKTSQPKIALISSSNSDSQYQGVPLDHLRTMLTPQEYIRVSILRSMSESSHAGNEKNVSRRIHPDLASSRPSLAFEVELRSMISTWVELMAVSGACLEILEAEAVRYTTILMAELKQAVLEHERTGTVNGRSQKQLMFSNQAQGIDPKLAALVERSKVVLSSASDKMDVDPISSGELKTSKAEEDNFEGGADVDEESEVEEEDFAENTNEADSRERVDTAEKEDEEYDPKAEWHSLKSMSNPKIVKASQYDRIPIAQMDHLAEALSLRHISLVRRLEYIARRLAEDARNQRVNEQSKSEQVQEEEEEDEEVLEAWTPSLDLEMHLSRQDSSETAERQHELREAMLSERMERVQRMSVAHLDEWQAASSISFARPNISKFKAWLNVCCHWNPKDICIPAPLVVAINFIVYEHLRYIVRTSIQTTSSSNGSGSTLRVLLPDRLRAEISARIEAGDAVHTNSLIEALQPSPTG